MSAFTPQNHKRTAIEWQEIARESNAEVGAQFTIIGGVVLGLFAAAAASPLTGLMIAGYFGYKAWQDTQAANRNDNAIDSYGCVAHLLKESDLKTYTRQIGAEKAIEEITFAIENSYRVTPAAIDFVEAHGVDVEAMTSDTPKVLPASDAPAVATDDAPGQPLEIIDLAKTLGRALKPLIISAMPRTGKGILISHARRYAKEFEPQLEIWVIDPKAHPSESGYWQGVDRLWAKPLDQFAVNDESIACEIEAFISEWRRSPARPKLLIFDELVLTEARLPKWFKEFVPSLMKTESSSGETDRRYLWAITQSPLVSDMGLSGGNRSAFNFVAMGRPQTLAHLESAKKSGFVRSVPTAEDFKASPVSILAYYSAFQTWVAIPEYVVPSPVPSVRARLENLYHFECGTTEETVTNSGNDGNDAETKSLPDVTTQPQSFEPIAFSTETVAKRFPETTETALFETILSGYRNGLPPNEIVKQSLKLGKDRYQEGRSLCCYLIRRYGNVELLLHFRKWIDQ